MRDAEQAIEKVLGGLREADIPEGMERRILRSVEERTAHRDVHKPWYLRIKILSYAGLASGVGITSVVLLVLFMPLMQKPAPLIPPEGGLRVAVTGGSIAVRANKVMLLDWSRIRGDGNGCDLSEPLPVSMARRTGKAALSVTASARSDVTDSTEALPTDLDALAVSEMLAPSKPAPPLPLTHQEKLLAQVVHKGEPETLATLRSDVRAKQMEISKAEFQDFFEPPVKANE